MDTIIIHRGKREESRGTIFSLSVENERADAGRDSRPTSRETNFSGENGDREK